MSKPNREDALDAMEKALDDYLETLAEETDRVKGEIASLRSQIIDKERDK